VTFNNLVTKVINTAPKWTDPLPEKLEIQISRDENGNLKDSSPFKYQSPKAEDAENQ